jgi:hypothetical protein
MRKSDSSMMSRDIKKIPAIIEITTKDLFFYEIGFKLESVVEQGCSITTKNGK